MGIGGSFGFEDAKSNEEKIAVLERKIAAYGQRFQEYDKYIADLLKKIEEQNEKFNDHEIKILLNDSELKYCTHQVSVHHSDVLRSFESVEKERNSASKKIESLQVQIDMVKDDAVHQKQLILNDCKNLTQDMASNSQVKSALEEINQKIKLIDSLNSIVNSFDQKIIDQASLSSAFFVELSLKINGIQDYIRSFEEKLSFCVAGQNSAKTECFDRYDKLIYDYQKYVADKVESLKNDLKGSSSDLKSIKEELMSKLESIALDGSNAVLRATNASSKVVLVEKKIENLYLLVDKLQLKA